MILLYLRPAIATSWDATGITTSRTMMTAGDDERTTTENNQGRRNREAPDEETMTSTIYADIIFLQVVMAVLMRSLIGSLAQRSIRVQHRAPERNSSRA